MNKYMGQKFNDWEVIGDGERPSYVLCRCKCGTEKEVHTYALTHGRSKSCGKCNVTDIKIGDHFGEWEVIGETDKNYMTPCRCSCGKERSVNKFTLLKGESLGCGHTKNKDRVIRLEGQHFGQLEVIKYLGDQKWLCKCSCGNERVAHRTKLISGLATRCKKCRYDNFIDIKGQRFGHLEPLKYVGDKKWLCKCHNCGKEKILLGQNLRNGSTISCDCVQKHFSEEQIMNIINTIKNEKSRKPFLNEIAKELEVSDKSTWYFIDKYDLRKELNNAFSSNIEREIAELCEKEYTNVELGNRSIIAPYELDIYIPEKKLAIEFNGNYWHSEFQKDKYYHQKKTIACAKKGIRLIHIFEYEWNDERKREILSNIIKNKEKYNKEVYITEIRDSIETQQFLAKNHLQGYTESNIELGCYTKDTNELIGVMTLYKKDEHRDKYIVSRLCWKPLLNVKDGISKFVQYIKDNYNVKTIITNIDIGKFTGNDYTDTGFNVTNITEPNHVWWNFNNNRDIVEHSIEQNSIDNAKDVCNNMEMQGYVKIHDSGSMELTLRL